MGVLDDQIKREITEVVERAKDEAVIATLARAAHEVAKNTGCSYEDALDLIGASQKIPNLKTWGCGEIFKPD